MQQPTVPFPPPRPSPFRRRRWTLAILLASVGLAIGLGWLAVRGPLRAASVLWSVFSPESPPAPVSWVTHPIDTEEADWELQGRRIRTRRYAPTSATRADPDALPPQRFGGVVLVHGVHHDGIDEPRLRRFATSLAAAGLTVVTPEIPELAQYRVEPTTIATIRASAAALSQQVGRERVCVVGISFAGGLSLLAAAEQAATHPIGCVVTLGAHHDLQRLARYYAGHQVHGPSGETYPGNPHPYGLLVILHAHLDKFFGPSELSHAREALALHMRGQHRAAHTALARMAEPQRTQLTEMLDRPDDALASALLEAVSAHADALEQVSPKGRLTGLQVPTFLVHGTHDPVVPSLETRWLADEVPAQHLDKVLVTPLLRHAEPEGVPAAGDVIALLDLMVAILGASD